MDGFEIAGYVVGLLGIVLAVFWGIKWRHLVGLLGELGEAFTHTSKVLQDRKLTKQEAQECLKEWRDVYTAVLLLIGRK